MHSASLPATSYTHSQMVDRPFLNFFASTTMASNRFYMHTSVANRDLLRAKSILLKYRMCLITFVIKKTPSYTLTQELFFFAPSPVRWIKKVGPLFLLVRSSFIVPR